MSDLTTADALALIRERGDRLTGRGLRYALLRGLIAGAHRHGRDWAIPEAGLLAYLNNRPRRGRKKEGA